MACGYSRAVAGMLLGLVAAAVRAAPSTPEALVPRAMMVSRDQAVAITAPPATMGYRGAILIFVDRFRRDFLRATQLELGRAELSILIRLGEATNDLRVLTQHGTAASGGEQECLELPDPEHADLDELRTALAQALVRQWRRAQGGGATGSSACEPPAWLVAGVARYADDGHRLEDLDHVQEQWLRGRLPPLAELLTDPPPVALQHRALQAVLAAWLLERDGGASFGTLLGRLDGGTPWPAAVTPAATNRTTRAVAELAEEWDLWQVRSLYKIVHAGVTTPGQVRTFRAQLFLYPADYGLPMADGWRGRPLRECLTWPLTPAVQGALRSQGMALRLFAAGRDGALQLVAADYATFCEALAGGGNAAALPALLAKAEEGRRQLEARVQSGTILQDPVQEALPVVQWR